MAKYTKFVTHNRTAKYDAYEYKKIEEFDEVLADGTLADNAFVMKVMGHLLGKVLTIVEATTPSGVQCDATKDLVRTAFSSEMEFVASMLFDQQKMNALANEAVADLPDDEIVEVGIEEILGTK